MAKVLAALKRSRATGKLNLANYELTLISDDVCDINSKSFDDQKWWELNPLIHLNVAYNEITSIPEKISNLRELVSLNMQHNQIESAPSQFFDFPNLQSIDLTGNELTEFTIPAESGNADIPEVYPVLKSLVLKDNALISIGDAICSLPKLEILNLRGNSLTTLPASMGQLSLLKLDLSQNKLEQLPESIGDLSNLRTLDCSKNRLKSLPSSLSKLDNLVTLNVAHNMLTQLPDLPSPGQLTELFAAYNELTEVAKISRCTSIVTVSFANNALTRISPKLSLLKEMRMLDVSNNNLNAIPPELGLLDGLKRLILEGNPMRRMKKALGMGAGSLELKRYLASKMDPNAAPIEAADDEDAVESKQDDERDYDSAPKKDELPPLWQVALDDGFAQKSLRVSDKRLEDIPEFVFTRELQSINFEKNLLKAIPDNIVRLVDTLTTLDLSSNAFEEFPTPLCRLANLSELKLRKNRLVLLPDSFEQLTRLVTADFRNNRFEKIPAMLGDMPRLRYLHISFNRLTSCDNLFASKHSRLEHLDISNNKLDLLPPDIRYAEHLTYLGLENNDLNTLPPELALCPHLQHLTCTGNPLRRLKYSLIRQGSSAILLYLKGRIPVSVLKSHDEEMQRARADAPPLSARGTPSREASTSAGSSTSSQVQQQTQNITAEPSTRSSDSRKPVAHERETPLRSSEPVAAPKPEPESKPSKEPSPASRRSDGGQTTESQAGASVSTQSSSPQVDTSELDKLTAQMKDLEDRLRDEQFSMTSAMVKKTKRLLMVAKSKKSREEKRLAELRSC